ncbi:MAG: serine/threonine-protein phosphatase [Actinomycetia bacterium]|nr:serine/threonine-protein phosphatase [Actinomycetes bacterium]
MSGTEATTEPNEGLDILDVARPLTPRRATTRWAVSTQPGRRGTNQDAWRVVDDCLFLIADGMGGLGAGDHAARAALDEVAGRPDAPEINDWRDALSAADARVARVAMDSQVGEAGTTIAGLVAYEGHAVISHLGDSRIHRLRDGRLTTLTRDHSISGDLEIDLTTGERPAAWRLDALTAFVGAGPDRLRDTALAVSARPGDRFILTTDGVHAVLDACELAVVAQTSSPDDAARALVQSAEAADSVDDRTALVVDFDEVRPIEGRERP